MNVPSDLLYTKEHEWVKLEGNFAKVGITNYAQESLGDITFVELPATGSSFEQSKQIATIESVKAASEVYAPVNGTVIEVNSNLEESPEIINESAEDKGWICKINNYNKEDFKDLMTLEEYSKFIAE